MTPEVLRTESERRQYGAVIALGKNWRLDGEKNVIATRRGSESRIYLSIESKLTALAAAHMYVSGETGLIIFSTGATAGKDPLTGKPFPTEADMMRSFVRRFYSEDQIPDSAMLVENNSFDTAGNAEEIKKKFIEPMNIQDAAVLTVGFHLPRSMRLFRSYGMDIREGLSSEEILISQGSDHLNRYIEAYHQTERYKDLVKLEKKVELFSRIDRKGKIVRFVTTRSRHRSEG